MVGKEHDKPEKIYLLILVNAVKHTVTSGPTELLAEYTTNLCADATGLLCEKKGNTNTLI